MDQPTGVGAVGCTRSGVARGQRALLEADDAVGDVHGVSVDRVDRRHADRCEVVREVYPRGWNLLYLVPSRPRFLSEARLAR